MRNDEQRVERRRGQVLIILAGMLFFGGGGMIASCSFLTGMSVKELDKRVDKKVADEAQRKGSKRTLKRWDEATQKYLGKVNNSSGRLRELLERHDATRAEIDAEFERFDVRADAFVEVALDHWSALRVRITDEEWAAIFRHPVEAEE
jgi:hypothetical protein